MRWIGALLFRNGQIEETGIAAGVLNHPANGVAWLANRLAPHDEHLAAGEVVLAGSFTRPVDIAGATRFMPITVRSDRCPASSSEQQRPEGEQR